MIQMTIRILLSALVAVFAVLIHEVSKYYYSLAILHPIHRKRTDMKVDIKKFIDPIGLILFIFSGVGWQKPGEYNPSRFKEKEKGLLMMAVVGNGANLLVMLACIPLSRYFSTPANWVEVYIYVFLALMVKYNFAIVIVNLLPVPPLDMSKVIYAFNPDFYFRMLQNERVIHAVFILIVAFGVLERFVQTLYSPILQLFY